MTGSLTCTLYRTQLSLLFFSQPHTVQMRCKYINSLLCYYVIYSQKCKNIPSWKSIIFPYRFYTLSIIFISSINKLFIYFFCLYFHLQIHFPLQIGQQLNFRVFCGSFWRQHYTKTMASETSPEFNLENRGQKRPIRPKLLKLTDVQMPSNRNRKKNKFKVKKITTKSENVFRNTQNKRIT